MANQQMILLQTLNNRAKTVYNLGDWALWGLVVPQPLTNEQKSDSREIMSRCRIYVCVRVCVGWQKKSKLCHDQIKTQIVMRICVRKKVSSS